jgi:hypothetical protein
MAPSASSLGCLWHFEVAGLAMVGFSRWVSAWRPPPHYQVCWVLRWPVWPGRVVPAGFSAWRPPPHFFFNLCCTTTCYDCPKYIGIIGSYHDKLNISQLWLQKGEIMFGHWTNPNPNGQNGALYPLLWFGDRPKWGDIKFKSSTVLSQVPSLLMFVYSFLTVLA